MTEGFKFFDKFIFKYEHYYASFYYTFCSQPYHINNGALFDALGVQIHIRVYETKGRRFLEDEFDTITANATKELKALLLTPNNNTDRLISYVNSKLKDIKTNKDVIANVIDSVNLEILNNDKIIDKTIIDRELYDFVTNKILVFEDWFNKLINVQTGQKEEIEENEIPFFYKDGLHLFKKYRAKFTDKFELVDLSFIVHQLIAEDKMAQFPQKKILEYLSKHQLISKELHDEFTENNQLISHTKSKAKFRIAYYESSLK